MDHISPPFSYHQSHVDTSPIELFQVLEREIDFYLRKKPRDRNQSSPMTLLRRQDSFVNGMAFYSLLQDNLLEFEDATNMSAEHLLTLIYSSYLAHYYLSKSLPATAQPDNSTGLRDKSRNQQDLVNIFALEDHEFYQEYQKINAKTVAYNDVTSSIPLIRIFVYNSISQVTKEPYQRLLTPEDVDYDPFLVTSSNKQPTEPLTTKTPFGVRWKNICPIFTPISLLAGEFYYSKKPQQGIGKERPYIYDWISDFHTVLNHMDSYSSNDDIQDAMETFKHYLETSSAWMKVCDESHGLCSFSFFLHQQYQYTYQKNLSIEGNIEQCAQVLTQQYLRKDAPDIDISLIQQEVQKDLLHLYQLHCKNGVTQDLMVMCSHSIMMIHEQTEYLKNIDDLPPYSSWAELKKEYLTELKKHLSQQSDLSNKNLDLFYQTGLHLCEYVDLCHQYLHRMIQEGDRPTETWIGPNHPGKVNHFFYEEIKQSLGEYEKNLLFDHIHHDQDLTVNPINGYTCQHKRLSEQNNKDNISTLDTSSKRRKI